MNALSTNPASRPRVGLIGFGAFGRFMAGHLRGHAEIAVSDRADVTEAAAALGLRACPIEEAAEREIVVLCVPAQHLESVLVRIAGRIRPGALVLDVCSVKVRPMDLMLRLVPPHASVIGTHPMFGPQSGKHGISGLPIAVCPGRCASGEADRLSVFLSGVLGLSVHLIAPDEHDRLMARVQALPHLLSRALGAVDLPNTPLATVAYRRLLAMRETLAHDSEELFRTIQCENPHAAAARRELLDELTSIDGSLGGTPGQKPSTPTP